MAWRTACSPPRRSCSATGICSGRSAASMALRCTVEVGTAGRSPRAGRPSPSPGRRLPGRRAPPVPGRSRGLAVAAVLAAGRGHRRLRRQRPAAAPVPALAVVVAPALREPGARITETSGARFGACP